MSVPSMVHSVLQTIGRTEKIQTMRAFGADVQMVPSDGGKVTKALFDRFHERIARLKDEPGTFWTDQFHNSDALQLVRASQSRQ